ncbi:MAG: EamA family transporter [Hyphomicrobiales bacterium]|nr:EamA family transporter [Hyphomicrobiales bacterium]
MLDVLKARPSLRAPAFLACQVSIPECRSLPLPSLALDWRFKPMSPSNYRLGLVLITASAVAWSTAGFFTRLIPLDAWTMLAWRGVFGALGIAFIVLAMERAGAVSTFQSMRGPAWSFALISAIGMIFFITSLRRTTVAHVAVIYATVPFVATALSWLVMRERPNVGAVGASVAAFAGVAMMVRLSVDGSLFGDLLAFAMTLAMAAMMVIARRYPNIPVMPAACLSALLSGLVCWPIGKPLAISGRELLLLAIFGLVNSALGLALFTVGARLLPAIETALIGSLDAPLAPLWVWFAFKETPSRSTLVGGLLVFVAVGYHIVATSRSIHAPLGPIPMHASDASGKSFPDMMKLWSGLFRQSIIRRGRSMSDPDDSAP